MTLDRSARDRVAEAIEQFLSGQIGAFAFDEAIFAVRTADKTVVQVTLRLWHHYDDCKDHQVNLAKWEWDYFQRLLLILRSDRELRVQRRWVWSTTQVVAATGVGLFCWALYHFGLNLYLLPLLVVLGLASMKLSSIRAHAVPLLSPAELALVPFVTLKQLAAVRREVTSFRKRRYPRAAGKIDIRNDCEKSRLIVQERVARIIWAPFILLFQMLPLERVHAEVLPKV